MPLAKNTREYAGTRWTRTDQNLDRIFVRDGIAYGTEIKNTLDYIPHEELETKIEMCATLGLRPLFIMRMAPKNYVYEVITAGGFCLIRTELTLPVDCPKAIADGTVKRLLTWHLRHLPQPNS